MRWIAALAASLIVVFSVSAAAAPLTPEATPFAGPPEVPGGPPPALADRWNTLQATNKNGCRGGPCAATSP